MTVENGTKSGVVGKVLNVPVKFENLEAQVDFAVSKNVPFDVVIGRHTLRRLGRVLNLRSEEVRYAY